MRQDIKERWVAALRSGKYKQGRKYLATNLEAGKLKYCCLGVLCELAVEDGVTTAREAPGGRVYGEEGEKAFPPGEVYEWAKLSYEDGRDLAIANDTRATFAEIADRIERDL